MAYLGVPQSKLENLTTNVQIVNLSASFDGTTVTFNLQDSRGDAVYAVHERALLVILGGIAQKPGVDYTTSGTTITFTTAPVSNLTIHIRKLYGVQRIIGVNDGVISPVKLSTGGPVWNSSGNVTISGDLNVTGSFNAGTNGLFWEDNERAKFGADNDLEIYHSGTDSFVRDSGTGNLYIEGTDLTLRASSASEMRYLEANASNGDVSLFFGNNKKFETTAQGISVTGDINGSGNFTLTSTNVGSTASPEIDLFRNSASPADADYIGQIKFTGKQDGGGTVNYAKITGKILDASNGTEDGIIEFMIRKAGSNNIAARFRSDSFQLLNGTSLTVNGNISTDANINLDDSTGSSVGRLILGNADDLQIFHDGSQNAINSYTEVPLNIISNGDTTIKTNNNDSMAVFKKNNAVELYYDNSKKFATTTDGAALFGNLGFRDNDKIELGQSSDLQIYHDGSHSYITNSTGAIYVLNDETIIKNAANSKTSLYANANDSVSLYFNNSKKFETTNTGAKVTGALEVTQEYPTIRPTLDLNFAATKTLDRRITFTRNSVGTFTDELGILRTATNNVPRFDHNPATGESLGLLIEESRTNLISTNIDDWNTSSTIKNKNAGIAPDGTNTANKCIRGPVATYQNVYATVTNVPTGTALIMSWYMKAAETDSIFFQTNDGGWINGTFDISGGGLQGNGGNLDGHGMYAVGNGWYRCWVKFDSAANSINLTFHPITSSPVSGNSVDGTLIWGVQLEVGSYITSYIPTNGSTVTRAQDTAKIDGTNFTDFYNQEEGTLVAHYYSTVDDGMIAMLESVTTPADDRIGFVNYAGYQGYVETGNVTQANIDNGTPTVGAINKVAYAFKANDFALSLNSATPSTDTSGTMPTVGRMMIGSRFGGQYDILKSSIRHLSYYPKRLPNAQLQSLTQQ